MIITIIVDTSGSMTVMAKNHIVSALINYCMDISEIDKERYARVKFRFITAAGEEIRDPGNTGGYFKKGENAGLSSLEKIFKTAGPNNMNFILLSDGLFPPGEKDEFLKIAENYPGLRLISAAVGADADESALREISCGNKVFRPGDIPSAVGFFLSEQGKCPDSIAAAGGGHG